MQRQTEITLLDELLTLQEAKTPYLDEHWERPDLERYLSAERFTLEREQISRRLPQIAALSAELPGPGDFLTLEMAGQPLLLVRDEAGQARAFFNVCRHRGARLVGDPSGCRQRFSCPYHAWTWNNSGELIGVPHEKSGFPQLDRGEFSLSALPCQEYGGWIWVSLARDQQIDVDSHLGDLAEEFLAMDAGNHVIFDTATREVAANWKLLVEGGIESYHFRVAHRDTIAGLFPDNLSSYRCFGRHMRSILPRTTLAELREQPEEQWNLRKHANVLYSLFPGSQFLVQEDHFVWIQGTPLAAGHTRLRLSTVVPRAEDREENRNYWRRHHQLTITTLDEDFDLAEGIQAGLACGANEHLNFGRYEGALARFNQSVDQALG